MKNLIVVNMARTGSSMVMGIFAAHGLNAPEGLIQDLSDGAKYWSYEQKKFKDWYRQNRIKDRTRDELGQFFSFANRGEFHAMVAELEKPWAFKIGVNYWRLVCDIPAVVVKVHRNPEAHARSMARKRNQDYQKTLEDIRIKGRLFDSIPGHWVYSDQLIRGDYSSLVPVFDELNIEMDPQTVRSGINTKEWHYHEKIQI